jgi:hypothetical protein
VRDEEKCGHCTENPVFINVCESCYFGLSDEAAKAEAYLKACKRMHMEWAHQRENHLEERARGVRNRRENRLSREVLKPDLAIAQERIAELEGACAGGMAKEASARAERGLAREQRDVARAEVDALDAANARIGEMEVHLYLIGNECGNEDPQTMHHAVSRLKSERDEAVHRASKMSISAGHHARMSDYHRARAARYLKACKRIHREWKRVMRAYTEVRRAELRQWSPVLLGNDSDLRNVARAKSKLDAANARIEELAALSGKRARDYGLAVDERDKARAEVDAITEQRDQAIIDRDDYWRQYQKEVDAVIGLRADGTTANHHSAGCIKRAEAREADSTGDDVTCPKCSDKGWVIDNDGDRAFCGCMDDDEDEDGGSVGGGALKCAKKAWQKIGMEPDLLARINKCAAAIRFMIEHLEAKESK